MTSPIITLTTDFGSRDGYAAAMKGVILGIHHGATIVDVAHDVPPQDIAHAAFVLGTTCPYFPPDAVHVAVVDPGVATERHPLLLVTPRGSYVAPDNGVVTYILMAEGVLAKPIAAPMAAEAMLAPIPVHVPSSCDAYLLSRNEYWLDHVSDTFHGRDVFAPVAAHLASGVPVEELGEPTDSVVCLSVPQPIADGDLIEGHVIHVDRFGNLVSNIRLKDSAKVGATVEIDGATIHGLSRSYSGGEEPGLSSPKGLVATVGSSGYLEIAAKNDSAAQQLGAAVGSRVRVTRTPSA